MSRETNKINISVFDSHDDVEKLQGVDTVSFNSSREIHSFDDLKKDDINSTTLGILEIKKNKTHCLVFSNQSGDAVKELDKLCSRTSVAQVALRHEKSGASSDVNITMVDIKEDRDDKEKELLRDIALMSLLESYGVSEKMFIPWLELKKMNIFFLNDLKYHFLQQKFTKKILTTTLYTSHTSFFLLLALCFFLICLSVLLFYFSTNFVEVQVPYDSTTSTFSLDLGNVSRWRKNAPVSIYADLKDFQSVYKSLQTLKGLQELKKSCDDIQTFRCFKIIRDIKTVPEIPAFVQLSDDAKMFPYGILEYLFFNDYFDIVHFDSQKTITLDTVHITAPYELIFFLKKSLLCKDQTSIHCWISPISPRFQNWMNIQHSYKNRILLARVPDGLLLEKYTIVWTKNVWPSESLNVKKNLVFVQFSALGTSQLIPCIICLCVGCVTLILTLFFHYF